MFPNCNKIIIKATFCDFITSNLLLCFWVQGLLTKLNHRSSRTRTVDNILNKLPCTSELNKSKKKKSKSKFWNFEICTQHSNYKKNPKIYLWAIVLQLLSLKCKTYNNLIQKTKSVSSLFCHLFLILKVSQI